ncbi:gentisate 1,2-dioxygenase [Pseudonocardia sp. CNS-139]|nr:gentisate 1,2-dioxygenase [Pseudonocardia sp. CNS-139]
MTIDATHTESELEEFYRDLAAVDLQPLWTITADLLTPTPRPKAVPWLWSAATMKPLARRAIRLVPVERGGERRVLSLQNPGLGGQPYAVGTLWGALQCLGPREKAPAHRHSPGAIRFVLAGEGVFTTVDGDACDMHPGDLVLTPAMNWHDHVNGGDGEMFWFDGLDLPMVAALDGTFFEPWAGPGLNQPEPAEHNVSERTYAGGTRHTDGAVTGPLSPRHSRLMVYRWADTTAQLDRLAAASDAPLLAVEYTDPETGASVMPTLACAVHRVRAGGRSLPVRRAGNAVYVVYSGHGSSVIAGQRFDWGPGDMFAVPSWAPVEHAADEQADLFVLTDTPVLRALGLYREERLAEAQPVTSVFEPR